MVRLVHGPTAPPPHHRVSPEDVAFAELSRLLSCLRQNVLHASPERMRRLRKSENQRIKAETNINYARTLLNTLEQEVAGVKAPARRLEMQRTLSMHRDSIETLLDRLHDIGQIAAEDDDDSSTEEEDLLADIRAKLDVGASPEKAEREEEIGAQAWSPEQAAAETVPMLGQESPLREEKTGFPAPMAEARDEAFTDTRQNLRARPSAHATSPPDSSYSTARASLFSKRRGASGTQASTATAEAILDHQRAEQDNLSESILKMAGALKESSQRFSSTLEADKETLGRAGESLDKTEGSMDAARGRMGALRKMTEGKGWWGRMMLYAWVYGLMVALVLLVFVLPKLRF